MAGSSPARPAKLFVVMRRDLAPGLRVAQGFHAARSFASEYPFVESDWFRHSNTIVLLEVEDGAALEDLLARVRDAGVCATSFEEDGIDGPTAAAIGPDGWKLTSSLPLALKED